jgi:hypothetical protein
MSKQEELRTEIICGRQFMPEEFLEIQETVRLFPKLSQTELAFTICENLSWYAPNGKYKIESCRELLKKLETRQWIKLPATRYPGRRNQEKHSPLELKAEPEICGTVSDLGTIKLEPVRGREKIQLWNQYVDLYHQLGYKRPFGAHQRYFIWASAPEERRLGCMLFSASAWALAERDSWIGWSKEEKSQRLHLIVNNTRFLIFPWVKVKNLASKTLSLATKQIRIDFLERYGYEPVLLETFVDTAHYQGTCYKAANWNSLGLTVGRGRMDRYNQYLLSPKQIFVYPLVPDFRTQLKVGGENQ